MEGGVPKARRRVIRAAKLFVVMSRFVAMKVFWLAHIKDLLRGVLGDLQQSLRLKLVG